MAGLGLVLGGDGMMDYEKLNELIREVENKKYIDVGDIEYTYLQEELYATRKKGERFPVFVRADSPEKALIKYNSFKDEKYPEEIKL